mmetsp:Transcript_17546/g.29606  ORF Transcript_17546/g.29606 Transcript_17546/m.29606 type:complete len:121 (+) Transcript_17546:758-1120(+)
MFIKKMTAAQFVRCFQVCVKHNVGSQHFFENYILDMIEKNVYRFNVEQYCTLVKLMADKGFQDDLIFWQKYAFKFVFLDPYTKGNRQFTVLEAQKIWDAYYYLGRFCTNLELQEVLTYLE